MTELKLLSPSEVSKILGFATSTLCRMRQTGTGPRCVWVTDHAPRYRVDDILAYVEARAS
jgi:predicted DNA-binding transcriptional regulator AlpA